MSVSAEAPGASLAHDLQDSLEAGVIDVVWPPFVVKRGLLEGMSRTALSTSSRTARGGRAGRTVIFLPNFILEGEEGCWERVWVLLDGGCGFTEGRGQNEIGRPSSWDGVHKWCRRLYRRTFFGAGTRIDLSSVPIIHLGGLALLATVRDHVTPHWIRVQPASYLAVS